MFSERKSKAIVKKSRELLRRYNLRRVVTDCHVTCPIGHRNAVATFTVRARSAEATVVCLSCKGDGNYFFNLEVE